MLCQILKRSMPYSINCILNCIHGTISTKSIVFAFEQWDYKVFFSPSSEYFPVLSQLSTLNTGYQKKNLRSSSINVGKPGHLHAQE